MEDNFIKATKKKLRFKVGNGNVSTEDLWDLPLETVDKLAVAYSKELDDTNTMSFIKPKRTNSDLALRFEIAKAVINIRVAEEEASRLRAEKQAKRAQLRDLLAKKELSALENKSVEELQKELDALEA